MDIKKTATTLNASLSFELNTTAQPTINIDKIDVIKCAVTYLLFIDYTIKKSSFFTKLNNTSSIIFYEIVIVAPSFSICL